MLDAINAKFYKYHKNPSKLFIIAIYMYSISFYNILFLNIINHNISIFTNNFIVWELISTISIDYIVFSFMATKIYGISLQGFTICFISKKSKLYTLLYTTLISYII